MKGAGTGTINDASIILRNVVNQERQQGVRHLAKRAITFTRKRCWQFS
jgi:hypothetical protein